MGKRTAEGHEKNKQDTLRRAKEKSLLGRDIGPPPACSDPKLRKQVEQDPEKFLTKLFPNLFTWKFSDEQKLSIKQFDEVTEIGGLQAIADPRGTGKTQRVIRQALKAILTGKRRYVCIVAATEKAARAIIKALRIILCGNLLLQSLFAAELHGFKQLKGTNRLARGQLCEGQPTEISIAADQIIFPTIPGSKCSGSIISSCGLTGNVRGQFHTLQDGEVIRPDLVVVDDPQTKESANSRSQTQERLEIVQADVLGLSGPSTSIACVVLCTVIAEQDLSDRILKDPKWHGRRTKTIDQWPDNMRAWDEYFDEYDLAICEGKPEKINALYKKRRKELDAGCKVGWESRIESGCISAIQTAMHVWHRVGPVAFASEYQNEPIKTDDSSQMITVDEILKRLNMLPRGEVPMKAEHITAAIDVHGDLLYWMICWWSQGFTGGVLNYGGWPDQKRSYFSLREANPTLTQFTKRTAKMAAVRAGLDGLISHLMGHVFRRPDGITMRVGKLCVDANWGEGTDTVYDACRESKYATQIRPTHGKGFSVLERPMSSWKPAQGEVAGHHWFRRVGKRAARFLLIDTNYWKTFIHNGLSLMPEEPHSISLFSASPHEHRLLADHLTAETLHKPKSEDGRTVDQWKNSQHADNHLFDCLVMNAVGASELGVTMSENARNKRPERKGPIKATYF